MFRAGHAGVGNDDGFAFEFAAVGFEKGGHAFTADFFLTFNQESQIAGQRRAGFEIGLDGLEMRKKLALIVRAAAREEVASLDARLKRRRFPKVERLRWLHVVMAIDNVVRLAG